jgi:hypothetical protein
VLLSSGYDELLTWQINNGSLSTPLAGALPPILLNKNVTRIDYTGGCKVTCADGSVYVAGTS